MAEVMNAWADMARAWVNAHATDEAQEPLYDCRISDPGSLGGQEDVIV
jgi:hypothetical protein